MKAQLGTQSQIYHSSLFNIDSMQVEQDVTLPMQRLAIGFDLVRLSKPIQAEQDRPFCQVKTCLCFKTAQLTCLLIIIIIALAFPYRSHPCKEPMTSFFILPVYCLCCCQALSFIKPLSGQILFFFVDSFLGKGKSDEMFKFTPFCHFFFVNNQSQSSISSSYFAQFTKISRDKTFGNLKLTFAALS